ncbi:GntR family transcriptional regulator [Agrilactobacillus composti DSM 18527 = JCM 14202]|uniref:GntR family transcriptional regulator n=1 Tax=Agrilactobacillus composti DSM 18527 = JCM 14202 TaxID=1423734 RepID=X0QLW2_9LACO|nr:TrkA C-terminal domain-containing protein [Agrilactobacillus composti]KRM31027.1 GntR family transcriptional regulator [Agrilactobacillus composti DSM 18527 = JCM 14202]GAF39600.1 transcriptional regulator, GntR family [Agrilactobacillus composti DSM 18527 = JCM 14202]
MSGIKQNQLARYQQIALDIASRIINQEYPIGTKIHARSTIANTYQVSPETARKAIKMLGDLKIVEAKRGSGFYVSSIENAGNFLDQFSNVKTLKDLKNDIQNIMARQAEDYRQLAELMNQFVDQTQRFNSVSPLVPFQYEIGAKSPHLNKSIGELQLWQNTTATIVAVRQGGQLKVSPGPYAVLNAGDTIFFVGAETSLQQVQSFFAG